MKKQRKDTKDEQRRVILVELANASTYWETYRIQNQLS